MRTYRVVIEVEVAIDDEEAVDGWDVIETELEDPDIWEVYTELYASSYPIHVEVDSYVSE